MITLLKSPTLTISFKRRGWGFVWCSEEGTTVLQFGFIIVEVSDE